MAEAPWVAPALGLLVGFALALTGAGGGVLSVPLLLFVLHLGMAQAAPVSLLAVTLAAGIGAWLAWRNRVLRYRAAGLMATAGLLCAPVGQWLAARLPEPPLMLLFAGVLAVAATRTLRLAARELRGEEGVRPANAPCRLDPATGRLHWTSRCAVVLTLAGALAGLLSGLLGVGGGFVLVPALLAATDLPMKAVVATSMGVIALVCAGAALSAAVQGRMPWEVALPFAGGAVAGLVGGRAWARRLSGPRLQQGFGVLSLGVALAMVVRALAR